MNTLLRDGFKEIIIREGLVDTGRLRDSISVNVSLNGPVLSVNIEAEDYVKYYLSDRKLVEQWSNLEVVKAELERLMTPAVEEMLQATLNGFKMDPSLLTIRLSVNGSPV
jgi:hypothetical protein